MFAAHPCLEVFVLLGKGLTAILAVQILQLKASKYFCIGYEVNPWD